MMSDPYREFEKIVLPALREFIEAEQARSFAIRDCTDIESARDIAVSRGRTAAIELHQFADFIFHVQPSWLPTFVKESEVRDWLEMTHCVSHTSGEPIHDVTALRDIADSYKHRKLLRPMKPPRVIVSVDAIEAITTGYATLEWSEGNYGGAEQTIVKMLDGRRRALSTILLNVQNAWRAAMGQPRVVSLLA